MAKLFESDDYIITNVVLLFLLINFNLEIGTIYIAMALVDWMAYYIAIDQKAIKTIPLEINPKKRWNALFISLVAYVGFIFISNILTLQIQPQLVNISGFERISALIAETFSATPILYGSQILKVTVWGILIPIIETRFFFRTLLMWGVASADYTLPQTALSLKSFAIAGFFGAVFAGFHFVAKSVTNNLTLMVTFFFGMVSVLLVIHYRQAIHAVFLHLITNSIATMQSLGVGFFKSGTAGINIEGILVLAGVILVSWFMLFQQMPVLSGWGT